MEFCAEPPTTAASGGVWEKGWEEEEEEVEKREGKRVFRSDGTWVCRRPMDDRALGEGMKKGLRNETREEDGDGDGGCERRTRRK